MEIDRTVHDSQMPDGWHTIKSVLLNELRTAANFHLCCRAAGALFHARLIGEGIARESGMFAQECVGAVRPEQQEEAPHPGGRWRAAKEKEAEGDE